MGNTSVISFAVIDRAKAIEEGVRIFVPQGPAGLSHRVLGALDYYCINTLCDCETAHLDVFLLEGEIKGFEVDPDARTFRRIGDIGYEPEIAKDPVRLTVDLSRGGVDFPKGHGAAKAEEEIMAQVRNGLTQDHIAVLKRHYQEAKAWGSDNYWRYADWSHLQEGQCVGWVEVFPKAEAWLFEAGGKRYLADDQYCINPSCECAEALITIIEIRPDFWRKSRAIQLGCVSYDFKTGQRAVRAAEHGKPEDLLRLAGILFSAMKDMPGELLRRHGFMRDFGRHVSGQVRNRPIPPSPETRTGPKPGRNAPCPCGSGKKYKKCCLGQEVIRESRTGPRGRWQARTKQGLAMTMMPPERTGEGPEACRQWSGPVMP